MKRVGASRLLNDIPSKFKAVRYHSLEADMSLWPKDLLCSAINSDNYGDACMVLEHLTRPWFGVQFHPDSICSDFGQAIIDNFASISHQYRTSKNMATVEMPEDVRAWNVLRPPSFPSVELSLKQDTFGLVYKMELQARVDHAFTNAAFKFLYGERATDVVFMDFATAPSEMCRFSIMGCLHACSDFGFAVSYSLVDRKVSLKRVDGTIQDIHLSAKEYFVDWISEQVSQFELDKVRVTDDVDSGGWTDVKVQELPFDFVGGLVGYYGYEMMHENSLYRDQDVIASSDVPDASFIFLDRCLVFDHLKNCVYLVALSSESQQEESTAWMRNVELKLCNVRPVSTTVNPVGPGDLNLKTEAHRDRYLACVEEAQQWIAEGESYEICLTCPFNFKFRSQPGRELAHPYALFSDLRLRNPAPFSAYFNSSLSATESTSFLISSSPERFMRIQDGQIYMKPIKGTRSRNTANPIADRPLRASLESSIKDQSENLMIVDLTDTTYNVSVSLCPYKFRN